jgi:Lrp/AsnC family transcriptional regulator, leucine-responsive regulatory protein
MSNQITSHAIDAIDRSILRCLQHDGRISNVELSERVGLSPAACHKRLKALESNGAIAKYVALINPRISGRTQIAFVQITLESQEGEDLENFERSITTCPQILACYLMTGTYDYLLHVLIKDADEYEQLHRSVLTRLPKVARVTSNFAIRQVRQTTAIPLDL